MRAAHFPAALVCAAVLAACEGKASPSDINNLMWEFDGVKAIADADGMFFDSPSRTSVQGYKCSSKAGVSISLGQGVSIAPVDITPGEVPAAGRFAIQFSEGGGSDWVGFSGQLFVTFLTNDTIAGSFNVMVTAKPETVKIGPKALTGSFRVKDTGKPPCG